MEIPEGFKVAVITPDGTVADTFDIAGAQLTKPLAAIDLGFHVEAAVERALGLDREEQIRG